VTEIASDDNAKEEASTSKKLSQFSSAPVLKATSSSPGTSPTTALKDMEIDMDNFERKQSWLTVENKTILKIYAFLKKYLLMAIDYIIESLNKHSHDFRHVSHILAKEVLMHFDKI
jgi:hypothetical protein